MEEAQMPDFVIVTGMSGAGRTEAMHVFEDLGYYCCLLYTSDAADE